MEYGVVVNNKFALFDNEDEDPLEVLQRSQEEATKKPIGKTAKDTKENSNAKVSAKNAKNTVKDTKPAVKSVTQPAKVLTPTQEQKQKPTSQNQPPRRDNAAVEKPPRFRQNENAPQRERRPPREENKDNQRVESEFRPERTELRSERDEFHGRGGGFRRGRGRGGVRSEEGFDRFGKREFERHSGSDRTGLKPVEKREGGGAHNWGTIADAVAEQEQQASKETTEHGTEADPQTNANEESNAEVEVAEPEEKQLTLDEWKALQDRNRTKAAFNIRKAGEGVSAAPEWKKMFVLKKKVADEHGEEEEEEEEEEEDDSRAKHKAQVPIQIKFNDSGSRGGGGFRGRGGRGGRGGASGPGGRRPDGDDQPRRGRSEKVDAVPNVDNELDFPSLA